MTTLYKIVPVPNENYTVAWDKENDKLFLSPYEGNSDKYQSYFTKEFVAEKWSEYLPFLVEVKDEVG